ncbi:MAG: FAA hydrolase family protein, partial [Ignavibacteriales bacterium]
AVISDFILKENYKLTLDEEISLSVNDEIRQKDRLNKMIFKPPQLVEYVTSLMTLEEGDLLFTGTPKGVGKVNKGDVLLAEIKEIARLQCSIS